MADEYKNHQFKKSLGQNFLKHSGIARDLVDAANIEIDDLVIEIGPGQGMVTKEILALTKNVILIEKDNNLEAFLREQYGSSVKIIMKDVLEINYSEITSQNDYIVIGSLPYNVSKKVIYNLLIGSHLPKRIAIIIQKEVAQDYAAKPPHATLLSNFSQIYSDVNLHQVVSADSFFPEPKVDGQIIVFSNITPKYLDHKALWGFIRSGFSSPRKIVASNLRPFGKEQVIRFLLSQGLSTTARASELTLENWRGLYNQVKKENND